MIANLKRENRGLGLTSVLLTSTLLATLVAAMMMLSQADLFVSLDSDLELDARLAAESVVALAINDLKQGEVALDRRFDYVPPEANSGVSSPRAYLHFDGESGEIYSTNNLSSGSAVRGWNDTLVPKRSIHLVGVGRAGAVQVVHEAFLGLGEYPFSVASNGVVRGTHLDVFAIESLQALADGISEADKKDGNVLSNHTGLESSVEFGANTTVTGNIDAAGSVQLNAGATVSGEVREGVNPQNLPVLDLARYDPQGGSQSFAEFHPGLRTITEGRARHQGDLNLTDLTLEDGLLFVDGDLTVSGRVEGYGAIVVTGDLRVTGSLSLASDMVALLAHGDVRIDGQGQDNTRLQGLVYTNGSFTARDATLVGAIVSSEVHGTTELERVNMIHTPEANQFEVVVDERLRQVTQGLAEQFNYTIGVQFGEAFVPFQKLYNADLRSLAESLLAGDEYQVKIFGPNGVEIPAENLPVEVRDEFWQRRNAWNHYVTEVERPREVLLSIDLNSFLSVEDRLKILKRVSYRKPLDRS